jgi:hypothetical protein
VAGRAALHAAGGEAIREHKSSLMLRDLCFPVASPPCAGRQAAGRPARGQPSIYQSAVLENRAMTLPVSGRWICDHPVA